VVQYLEGVVVVEPLLYLVKDWLSEELGALLEVMLLVMAVAVAVAVAEQPEVVVDLDTLALPIGVLIK
jgi:sensor histidine kinase regulating citrate/malate metabolism